MKKISIIIPAYNAGKFIDKCLTSISRQTFSDYEVIVSNDGSTDNTIEVINNFISRNPQIDVKLISDVNAGVSMARKRALLAATGEWVTFVDADDTIPSNSLSDLYSQAGEKTDLVVGFLLPKSEKIEETQEQKAW